MTQDLRIADKALAIESSDLKDAEFVLPRSDLNNFGVYHGEITDKAAVYIRNDIGYYNWFTATAGEGIKTKTTGDTSVSICAKGWKLPTYDESNKLISSYSLTSFQQAPAMFKPTGYIGRDENDNTDASSEVERPLLYPHV